MPQEAGQTLSHYRLVEKIGEGGMGVVWKAEDTVLGRTVAIKVLPADAARDESRRQMLFDEAKLASSVGGANVVQVFEFGREGDLDFIVMEHVEGSPLSKILHGRPLPPDKIANLASQIASGLSKAHRKGLLHRDLKPANILVTPEGDAKILDFGLAALFQLDDEDAGSHLETRAALDSASGGKIAGTLPYMSPEQVRGERLDTRSDIFSLGIILYEMTTGQRPFTGPSTTDLAEEVKRARPRPVHELNRDVPLDLHRIVEKALAPRPSERYQTMEDLAVDLRRLGRDLESGSSTSYQQLEKRAAAGSKRRTGLVAGAIAAALVAVAAAVVLLPGLLAPPADASTLMILPMEVRGQSQGAEYVGQAFSEALAVNLAQLEGLTVLPVPAAGPRVESRREDPRLAASDDGAGRMLTGAITRTGETVQASLSLVSTTENRILWGTQGEATEKELPRLASTLARQAGEALGITAPRLYDATLNQTGGPEMAASPATAEALGSLRRNEVPRALASTERLVRLFPDEPAAHVLRGSALVAIWLESADTETLEEMEEVLASLRRIDPDHPHSALLRAFALAFQSPAREGNLAGAPALLGGNLAEANRLLTEILERSDLTPALRVEALGARAWPRRNLGDMDGAIRDLEAALGLEPTNAQILSDLGVMLHEVGRSREAVLKARHSVALEPNDWNHYHQLSRVLKGAGDMEAAAEASRKACEMSQIQQPCAAHAGNLIQAGRSEEAHQWAELSATLPESIAGSYNLACFYALADEREPALKWLRKAMDLGGGAMWITRDPDLASLRGDPEFEAIMDEMKERLRAGDEPEGGAP